MVSISANIIILGLIAGFILYKLYSILGQKDDDGSIVDQNHYNNLIDISNLVKPAEEPVVLSETEVKLAIGFEEVINKIRTIDASFSLEKFLNGAKNAFEMILLAFAENDRSTLESLLGDNVYKQFISEIDSRIKNGVTLNLTLVALPIVEIKNIQLNNKQATIEVFYQSQQITLLKNDKGEIVEGNVTQIDNINDTWVFSKELNSKDTWHLIKVSTS